MELEGLKKGDSVIMAGCCEAKMPEYKGKIWRCRTDSFICKSGHEVVFLVGFSGHFLAEFLIKIDINTLINE